MPDELTDRVQSILDRRHSAAAARYAAHNRARLAKLETCSAATLKDCSGPIRSYMNAALCEAHAPAQPYVDPSLTATALKARASRLRREDSQTP